MKSYLVVKRVNLLVGNKTYRKDAIITAEMVGEDRISRYLARGYIKAVGTSPILEQPEVNNLPFYITAEDYLPPQEVNKLLRPDLMAYADHIGVEYKANIPTKRLQTLVNKFIDEFEDEDDSGDGVDDDTDIPNNGADDSNKEDESGKDGA